jgi:hypothetical protein
MWSNDAMVISWGKLMKLHQFHFTNHKPHMELPRIKLEVPGLEARV